MMQRRTFIKQSALVTGLSPLATSTTLSPRQDQVQGASLANKIEGALYAQAIGDGMGAPVEGWSPQKIAQQFGQHDFSTFLPPTKPKDIANNRGKGHGRMTDDMLWLEALVAAYQAHEDHLDAYTYAQYIIPEIEREVYVPERKDIRPAMDRPIWWPERYVYQRLAINNAEPRTAGVGNWVNEGFCSLGMPTGAVNAGDPWAAYREAAAFGAAHTESYGLEGGCVNAAAFAEAFAPDSSLESVVAVAIEVAKDGTALALADMQAVVDPKDDLMTFIEKVRKAWLPYSQIAPRALAQKEPQVPGKDKQGTNRGRPSRLACIENVPAAYACLQYGQGDYLKTLKACIRYGQDCESIALVATGLLAAIKGVEIIPLALRTASKQANQRDWTQIAKSFYQTVNKIYQKDVQRLARRGIF